MNRKHYSSLTRCERMSAYGEVASLPVRMGNRGGV